MNWFLDSFCRFSKSICEEEKDKIKPEAWNVSHTELRTLLKSSFPKADLYLWDRRYYYVKHEDWGKILEDVLLNMPEYTTSRFDCENFAMLCSGRVCERYKINTMGVAIGAVNGHAHGFNLFVSRVDDKPSLFILEPQSGEVYTPEEPSGYEISYVIFG